MLLPARACVGAVLNRDTFIAASVKLSASHNHVPGSYMVGIILLIWVPMRHVLRARLHTIHMSPILGSGEEVALVYAGWGAP